MPPHKSTYIHTYIHTHIHTVHNTVTRVRTNPHAYTHTHKLSITQSQDNSHPPANPRTGGTWCPDPFTRRGFLERKTTRGKGCMCVGGSKWVTRLFELRGSHLSYYRGLKDTKPRRTWYVCVYMHVYTCVSRLKDATLRVRGMYVCMYVCDLYE